MKRTVYLLIIGFSVVVSAQEKKAETPGHEDLNKFRQMYDLLGTPNRYRTASGAPGPEYYQQQADYKMTLELDDRNQKLHGTETITYHNNAKESLDYLWIQLDQNILARDSQTPLAKNQTGEVAITARNFSKKYLEPPFDGGFKIDYVKGPDGNELPHTVNYTMMRIDLPKPLKHGETFSFSIKWWYKINNYMIDNGRSGYEHFEDGNNLYVLAQFYPRMAVYNDVEGWQNMQFWGSGEFALPFGNFDVSLTVPADHIVEATGELQNRNEVFSPEQQKRYARAQQTFDKPVVIVTQAEAEAAEKGFSTRTKTWKFRAVNVRDFGISTSRKFIYDAMAVKLGTKTAMAISLYPKEGNPLWGEYSTKIVAHTLKSYSSHTFDYPYPKAISINARDQGMEYPMICWNFGRPEADGSYTDRVKFGMMGVIIHEVGHNFFPMIVNSDERQWTWMDEGLNSFCEYLAEKSWDPDFPSRRGPAKLIVPYMAGDQSMLEPIMTNSESIRQFGSNAYSKPATALNILRETVMGPELFDFAFKTYANRWKFKHPTPDDFFRTIEDASAVDLDWFWRGWFFTTDYNDIGIGNVKRFVVSNGPPSDYKTPHNEARTRFVTPGPQVYLVGEDNASFNPEIDKAFEIRNFGVVEDYISQHFSETEKANLKTPKYFYEVTFEKPGGLVMPLIVALTYDDGTSETLRFPAQIWKLNDRQVTRIFASEQKIAKITIDPKEETADVDLSNNNWPKQALTSKFD